MDFAKLNLSISLNPTSAFPVDGRSLFSTYENAVIAAMSACEVGSFDSQFYFGQNITVIDGVNSDSATIYVIVNDKTKNNLQRVCEVDLSNYYTKPEIDKKLKAETAEIKKLDKIILNVEKEVETVSKDVDKVKEKVVILDKSLTEVKKETEKITKDIRTLHTDVEKNKEDIKKIQEQTVKTNKELKTVKLNVEAAQKDITKIKTILDVSGPTGLKIDSKTGKLSAKISNKGNVKIKKTEDGLDANFFWLEYD